MIFELVIIMLVFFGTLAAGGLMCVLEWKWSDRKRKKEAEE